MKNDRNGEIHFRNGRMNCRKVRKADSPLRKSFQSVGIFFACGVSPFRTNIAANRKYIHV